MPRFVAVYDQVAAQLQQRRDVYAQACEIGVFQRRLGQFRHRYSNRPAMLRRTEKQ